MSDDNVMPFPVKPKKPDGVTLKVLQTWERKGCQHSPDGNTYVVDQAQQTVECGKCGAKLSPYWVMLQLADRESYWHRNWERYVNAKKQFEARVRTKCRHCGKMTELR